MGLEIPTPGNYGHPGTMGARDFVFGFATILAKMRVSGEDDYLLFQFLAIRKKGISSSAERHRYFPQMRRVFSESSTDRGFLAKNAISNARNHYGARYYHRI